MNWYKEALFDSGLDSCSKWVSTGTGKGKVCDLGDGDKASISVEHLFGIEYLFKQSTIYSRFLKEYPHLQQSDLDGYEVIFSVNGTVDSDRSKVKGRGKAFQVMNSVVGVLKEVEKEVDFFYFTPYKKDNNGENRASLYRAMVSRFAQERGLQQIDTGDPDATFLIKSLVLQGIDENAQTSGWNDGEDDDFEAYYNDMPDPDFYEPTEEDLQRAMQGVW